MHFFLGAHKDCMDPYECQVPRNDKPEFGICFCLLGLKGSYVE